MRCWRWGAVASLADIGRDGARLVPLGDGPNGKSIPRRLECKLDDYRQSARVVGALCLETEGYWLVWGFVARRGLFSDGRWALGR